jgi:nucleoside-diphosphate-sugar epimerase
MRQDLLAGIQLDCHIDPVTHTAALSDLKIAHRVNLFDIQNRLATVKLIRAVREKSKPLFVYFSSLSFYGASEDLKMPPHLRMLMVLVSWQQSDLPPQLVPALIRFS